MNLMYAIYHFYYPSICTPTQTMGSFCSREPSTQSKIDTLRQESVKVQEATETVLQITLESASVFSDEELIAQATRELFVEGLKRAKRYVKDKPESDTIGEWFKQNTTFSNRIQGMAITAFNNSSATANWSLYRYQRSPEFDYNYEHQEDADVCEYTQEFGDKFREYAEQELVLFDEATEWFCKKLVKLIRVVQKERGFVGTSLSYRNPNPPTSRLWKRHNISKAVVKRINNTNLLSGWVLDRREFDSTKWQIGRKNVPVDDMFWADQHTNFTYEMIKLCIELRELAEYDELMQTAELESIFVKVVDAFKEMSIRENDSINNHRLEIKCTEFYSKYVQYPEEVQRNENLCIPWNQWDKRAGITMNIGPRCGCGKYTCPGKIMFYPPSKEYALNKAPPSDAPLSM